MEVHALPLFQHPKTLQQTRARKPDATTLGLGLESWALRTPRSVYKSFQKNRSRWPSIQSASLLYQQSSRTISPVPPGSPTSDDTSSRTFSPLSSTTSDNTSIQSVSHYHWDPQPPTTDFSTSEQSLRCSFPQLPSCMTLSDAGCCGLLRPLATAC